MKKILQATRALIGCYALAAVAVKLQHLLTYEVQPPLSKLIAGTLSMGTGALFGLALSIPVAYAAMDIEQRFKERRMNRDLKASLAEIELIKREQGSPERLIHRLQLTHARAKQSNGRQGMIGMALMASGVFLGGSAGDTYATPYVDSVVEQMLTPSPAPLSSIHR